MKNKLVGLLELKTAVLECFLEKTPLSPLGVKASTKPPIHNLIHNFLINMAFTIACPNFKKGLKMAFGPLGVNLWMKPNGKTKRSVHTPTCKSITKCLLWRIEGITHLS
jgi:hypothetical protein